MGDPADGENAQRAADNRGYGTDGVKAVEERRLGMVESSRADSRGFDDLPYAGFRTVIGGTEYNSEERPEQCDAQRVADFSAIAPAAPARDSGTAPTAVSATRLNEMPNPIPATTVDVM